MHLHAKYEDPQSFLSRTARRRIQQRPLQNACLFSVDIHILFSVFLFCALKTDVYVIYKGGRYSFCPYLGHIWPCNLKLGQNIGQ